MAEFSTKQREALADKKQAMPDGSYPIRNIKDLKNAIASYGRAKNPEAVKRWIKKRAKALGAESLLPGSWKDGNAVSHSAISSKKVYYVKQTWGH